MRLYSGVAKLFSVEFFITVLILSIPLWAEWALPVLKNYLQSAVKMVNDLGELLDRTRRMNGI
jgi:hypothetical protein